MWRCEGSVTVGAIWREDYGCAEGQIVVDCSGNILERHRFAVGSDLCPVATEVFRQYCDPASAFSRSDGVCELVDYYGNRIRLRVCAPPHEFEARPYPEERA
ncbi:MAG: hypothetical protein RMM07_12110 [Anaerolineae bacterium]|nr:hypothetical protein [Anaerolineae bacterium]